LKIIRSLKPKPPANFAHPIFSQLIQEIFEEFDMCPNQNLVIILFNSLVWLESQPLKVSISLLERGT
jgi:hypothetical protein